MGSEMCIRDRIDSIILYRIQKISKECAGQIQEAVDALNGNIIDVDDDVR